MNKAVINQKMEIVKDFFKIDNKDISKMLNRKETVTEFNFGNLNIQELLTLTRALNLSLDVLEEIFCSKDVNMYNCVSIEYKE